MSSKKQQQRKQHGKGRPVPRSVYTRVTVPHRRVCLPYAQSGILTEAAAGLGIFQTWGINNAFDPDVTGGGLQPLGFDQYAQFYGRYRVLGVTVDLMWGARTAGEPTIVGCYAAPSSALPAVAIAWTVQPTPTLRTGLISGTTAGPSLTRQRQRIKIQDVLGVTYTEFRDDQDFSAILTAAPARPAYLHTFIKSLTGNVASVHYLFRMWMDIEFTQPVNLGMS